MVVLVRGQEAAGACRRSAMPLKVSLEGRNAQVLAEDASIRSGLLARSGGVALGAVKGARRKAVGGRSVSVMVGNA
jgi:hypothetical protein